MEADWRNLLREPLDEKITGYSPAMGITVAAIQIASASGNSNSLESQSLSEKNLASAPTSFRPTHSVFCWRKVELMRRGGLLFDLRGQCFEARVTVKRSQIRIRENLQALSVGHDNC